MLYINLMCISHFMFFTNDWLVAVYFIFILDYINNVTQKQIQVIFLLEFKMGCKAAETTRNINNTFGPGTAKEHTVQWWFNKFCKGDESLEDEERSGWPLEVDNDQLRAITGADPLTTTEVAKELNVDHPMFIWHLKQIGKVKKLNKWVPHKVTANQKKKKRSFWTVVFSYSTQQQQTMSQPDCDVQWKMDCIQLVMTSSLAGPRSSKVLPKAKFAPKKSLFGGLLLLWSTTAFWILAKPLHLRSMLSKLMKCTKNGNASHEHWSTE